MLALERLAERQFHNLRTQTRGLAFVVEVNTINGVLVLVECQITADTAPETFTAERQNVLDSTVEVSDIDFGFAVFERVLHEGVIDLGRVSLAEVHLECTEDLFLLVEQDVSVLTRLERLVSERQQDRYDNHHNRHIDEGVHIRIRIQFHSGPPYLMTRFARRLIFACTTHQSISGAKAFISRIASIIPSG